MTPQVRVGVGREGQDCGGEENRKAQGRHGCRCIIFQPAPIQRDSMLFATALGVWPTLVSARPQMFSLLFFAALLSVLTRVRDGHRKLLVFVPLIFAVWVNVHGGWLVGAGVLAVYTACGMVDAALTVRHRRLLIAASIASALATLCNPYGLRMLGFLLETVRPNRTDIQEWQSLTSLPPILVAFWLVPTAIAIAAAWRGRHGISISSLAIVVVLAIASFRVVRIVSFYALAVGFLVAPYAWSKVTLGQAQPRRTFREWQLAVLACLSIIAVSVGLFGRRIVMDGSWAARTRSGRLCLEPSPPGKHVHLVRLRRIPDLAFLAAIRVSIDGRRETAFTEELRAAHFRIYADAPGALEELRQEPRAFPGP